MNRLELRANGWDDRCPQALIPADPWLFKFFCRTLNRISVQRIRWPSIHVAPFHYSEEMDPTLAALIGTLCGAAITAVVPIATYRGSKREAELSRRRQETAALLEVLLRLMDTRVQGNIPEFSATRTQAILAVERVLLLADTRDAPELQHVTQFVFEFVTDQDRLGAISASVEAMSMTLRGWSRGELRGKRIGDAYGKSLEARLNVRVRQ